ncbi:MAG: VPLPA-CTERM sorting domain-containing protein [Nitrospirota bacterium]
MKRHRRTLRRVLTGLAAAAVAVVGFSGQAQAVSFPNGQLGLIVYGGDTEMYWNLGDSNALLAPGAAASFTISGTDLATLQTGATTGVRYTLVSYDPLAGAFKFGASTATPTATQLGNSFPDNAADLFFGWQGLLGQPINTGTTNPAFVNKGASHSFSSTFGTAGRLGGTMGFNIESAFGNELFIHMYDQFTQEYTRMGNAFLLAVDGGATLFLGNPAVVPIPAAVVLFGTGLIGLVGIARRSLARTQAA